ncbi:hypothetical protein CIK05_15245 [Bdellovibrio sp. qaytius]|nr:hypothetical protein CIK05_15245 [Bdellovibrio sp. qaytius]
MNLASLIQILVLALSMLVFSCTPKGEGILNNKSSIAETVDNATKQAPFAYDIAADTISYNSCVNYVADSGSTNNPIPGLVIGVNEGFVTNNGNGAVKGGLKLRTAFLQHIGHYIKPQAPSSTVTPEQVQKVLQQSTANMGAYMQFSIRRKTDLTLNVDLISPGANNNINSLIPQPNRDAILFLQDLTTGFVGNMLTKEIKFTGTGTVLAEGSRTYNLSDTPDPVPIQASFGLNQTADETLPASTDNSNGNPEIKFGIAEYYSDIVRKKFNSTANDRVILTAVFGGKALDGANVTEETISQVRRQTSDVSKAFGRGYSLKFEPKVRNVAGWVNNVLSGTAVTEIDLSTGTTVQGAQWTCENFLIALPAHYDNKKLGEPTCSPLVATDMTEARQLAVKKIRRQQSAADWNIGLFIPKDTALGVTPQDRIANRANYQICVSPRRSSCYLPTTDIFSSAENASKDAGIQYDTSQECYLTAYNLMGANYTSATTPDAKRLLGRCANYLSVCTRSSTNF